MVNIKYLCIVLIFFLLINLCACQKFGASQDDYAPLLINGKAFTIDEVNEGIKNTFNSVLYYHGDDPNSKYLTSNKNLILQKKISYDLFFEPNFYTGEKAFVFSPKIYFVITNINHPLSTKEKLQLYVFGVDITEFGLRSDFSYQGHTIKENYNFLNDNIIYLGNHTMYIEKIKKPIYEAIDVEWSKKVENSIKLYMDKNDYYTNGGNLAPGKYLVYVQKFFRSDKNSTIIFVNQNGSTYKGDYYFVHDVFNNQPADLNNVVFVENVDKPKLLSYFEKIKTDPAIVVEYVVK